MSQNPFAIAGRAIGPGNPPYLVAELGINHGGRLEVARRMLRAAVEAGADAIKLQTFRTDLFLSRSSEYYDVLASAELGESAIRDLQELARELGTTLFSAVFDEPSADLWESFDAPAYKIASGDLTHHPLIKHVAAFGKPMLLSTGGATMGEIEAAIDAIGGRAPVALFHCVSSYPTDPKDANLACMATMRARFGMPIGFSDHTLGNVTSIAAVAMGADIVEKHFTLDREAEGPDHRLSADPAGLSELAAALRCAQQSIGTSEKKPVEAPGFILQIRRSVVALVDIDEGTVVEPRMLAVKRPGTGIPPRDIDAVIGRTASRYIAADQALSWDDFN